jgi:ATP/maltotriose-dependent transcriptional regulator MalT
MTLYDWKRAEALAEEARSLARPVKSIVTIVSEGLDLMRIYIQRGDLDQAAVMISEIKDNIALGGKTHEEIWLTRLATAQAELAFARKDFEETLLFAGRAFDQAVAIGRPKYESLALSLRGRALASLGRMPEGLINLRKAIDLSRAVGDPSMLLNAAVSYLEVEADAAIAAEARRAVERMLTGLSDPRRRAIFQASEAVRLVSRLTDTAALQAKEVFPDHLSKREVGVLRLIASGRSNQEIADALVLSRRTVERHIANLYTKTAVRTKAQATDYAHRNGLT